MAEKAISAPPTTPPDRKWYLRLVDAILSQTTFEGTLGTTTITGVETADLTIDGIDINDIVQVNPPALPAGLLLTHYRVSAADTVTLTFYNTTGGGLDAAGTYHLVATRK